MPCQSCGANPGLPSHTCIAMPSAALPNHACRAMPFLERDWPRHTVPAVPSRAIPVHTTTANPILAHPSLPHLPRRYWPGNAMPRLPHLAMPPVPCLACRACSWLSGPCLACIAVPCTIPTTTSQPCLNRPCLAKPCLPVLAASCRALQSHACKTLERRALPNLPCQFSGGSIATAVEIIRVTLSRTGQNQALRSSCCRAGLRRYPPEDQLGKSGLLRRSW